VNLRLALTVSLAALLTACAVDRSTTEDENAESSSAAATDNNELTSTEDLDAIVEDGSNPEYAVMTDGTPDEIFEMAYETDNGLLKLKYREIDGIPIAEGDVVLGTGEPWQTRAATTIARRWNRAVVPYVIDPNLPDPARATNAIQHWKERTNVRFTPRTSETDYVTFRPGSGCSSMIGRVGGNQMITLSMGEAASSTAAVGIDRSSNVAYYFYKRGFATAGSPTRADGKYTHFKYTLPAGKTTANLIDVGFTSSGHVVAWYNDGSFSEGTTTNFAQYQAPASYGLAPNKTPADVLGFAIDGNNVAYAFYKDGTYSRGVASNLASSSVGNAFSVHSSESVDKLAHVDVAQNGAFVAFYSDGRTSSGTVSSLGSASTGATLSRTSYPGHCSMGSAIHEIGHAVGFFHEQTRRDRDDWVTINTANISSSSQHNFAKYNVSTGQDLGPYDFGSIMHYSSYAFSINGQPTILKKDGGTIEGQRVALSTNDVAAALNMYPGPAAF